MKCIIAKMDSEGEGLTHSAESLSLYGFNYRTQGIGGRKLAIDVLPEDKMAFRLWLESNRGHGMPGVRQWLHQRFGSTELVEASSKEKQQSMPAVITPDTVPQFVIPFGFSDTSSAVSNGLISPTVESNSGDLRYENQNVRSSPVVEENRVSKSSKGSFESLDFELQFPDHNSLNSTPSSPIGTNDDPFSAAAVSLPHLRTLTSFGFTTVLESPHTRRKESLLLGSTSMADIKQLIKRKMLAAGNRSLSAMQYTEKLKESDLYGPVVPNAYRSLSSSSISLKSEPLSESPPTSIWTRNTAMSRQYQRRRSSDKSTTNQEYGSTEVSQNKMSKEEAQGLATLGEIKFSIVYLKKMSSLKLSVIKAEQLAKDIKDKSQLNMTVKSTLLPDKSQRHETMSIRATHDPQYNQVFAFKDVSLCDIETKALRLRVFNKPSSRKKDLLGEVILPLEHLGLRHEEEVRMWRDLEPQQESECRGFINISMRFEPREDRLSVTVIEARGLPKSIITGLPDPYICINVTQDGKTFIKKQTRTRKSTDHPVFKETFVFSISPKVDCIKYTAIKIRVMSKVKLASDATMGVLTFGYGSTEEHQIIHWNKVLSNTNNDIQQWHTLCKPTA